MNMNNREKYIDPQTYNITVTYTIHAAKVTVTTNYTDLTAYANIFNENTCAYLYTKIKTTYE